MGVGPWSLDLIGFVLCPQLKPLPSTPSTITAAALAGVTFLPWGGPMGHWHHGETRVDLGLSLALTFNGIQGKVKRGPLLGVPRQIRRISLCRCALLSKLQNTFTRVLLSFHALLYDQGGKQGSHREHEPRATSVASKFSILPMPCLRHTTGHSPEAVQSDLGWVYNLRGL